VKDRWLAFWKASGATGDPERPWRFLSDAYSEPQRKYHTLRHIGHCLEEFEPARGLAKDPVAVEMALWYHDVVYDPRSKENEERSAVLADEAAAVMGWDRGRRERITGLIRASTHVAAAEESDARLFTDIDLSILGQPWAIFDEYERQIREEYAWVSDPAFRSGRGALLRSFLARASIYGTPAFREKYETAARRNLSASIGRLTGSAP